MQKLTRPHRDATRDDKLTYLQTLSDALDAEGVGGGEQFLVASARPDNGFYAVPEATANSLGPIGNGDTSRQAALDNYPRSGSQRHVILGALVQTGAGGLTRTELALGLGLSESSVRPRVLELRDGGWLIETPRTRRTPTGSEATVLVATDKGRDAVHAEMASRN